MALANATVQEFPNELRQQRTAVLLSLWIFSMAFGNLGVDKFCTFNQIQYHAYYRAETYIVKNIKDNFFVLQNNYIK